MSRSIDEAVERYRVILNSERLDLQKRLEALAISQRYVTTKKILSESYRLRHYLQAAGLEHLANEWVEEVLEPLAANPWNNGLASWKKRRD